MNSCQRQRRVAARRTQFDLGIQDQQRRHAVGGRRGVAEIAGDGGDVLDLHRADFARGLLQRVESRRQGMADEIGPGRARADDPMACRSRDAAQRSQAVDVEDIVAKRLGCRARDRNRCRRQESARRLAEQSERLVERGGFRVTDHAAFQKMGLSRKAGLPETLPAFDGQIHSYANDIKLAGIVKAGVCARSSVATHLLRPQRLTQAAIWSSFCIRSHRGVFHRYPLETRKRRGPWPTKRLSSSTCRTISAPAARWRLPAATRSCRWSTI